MTVRSIIHACGSAVLIACVGFGAVGCAPNTAASAGPIDAEGNDTDVRLPPLPGRADYQLAGGYEPPEGTTVLARDSSEPAHESIYSICYVNGFQTQPGETDAWLQNSPELVLHRSGAPVPDPNWPDEFLLDTSTEAKREGILELIGSVITGCASSGYEAVEIDNLDTFTRSGGLLAESDNVALAAGYAEIAHENGLAIAQKNSAEFSELFRADVGFDFAVAEECMVWNECSDYVDAYGDYVVDIEYTDDHGETFSALCTSPGRPATMILRDRNLVTPAHPDYAYETCP